MFAHKEPSQSIPGDMGDGAQGHHHVVFDYHRAKDLRRAPIRESNGMH